MFLGRPQSGRAVNPSHQERILLALWGLFEIALHQTPTKIATSVLKMSTILRSTNFCESHVGGEIKNIAFLRH
jgi:hypothetical protein